MHQRVEDTVRQTSCGLEQRNYLLKISTEFQSLTAHALDAYYARDKCFEELRLATIIKSLQEEFSATMRTKGHTRKFSRQTKNYKVARPNPSISQAKKNSNSLASQESSSGDSDTDETESKAINPLSLAVEPEKQKELRSVLELTIPSGNKLCEDIMT